MAASLLPRVSGGGGSERSELTEGASRRRPAPPDVRTVAGERRRSAFAGLVLSALGALVGDLGGGLDLGRSVLGGGFDRG